MDAQVAILAVSVRNTKTGKTVYDVACSDNVKRQVWEPELAVALNNYAGTGQPVTIRFDRTQNGKYVNESIQEFAAPGTQLPPDMSAQLAPMAQPLGLVGGALPVAGVIPQPIQAAPSGGSGWSPETTTRVTKLACYEYASQLVGALLTGAGQEALTEALAMTDAAAKHFYTAARSHEHAESVGVPLPAGQGMIIPTATTPQAVAALVPGVVVGASVAAAQDAAAEAPDVIQWD